MLGKPALFVSIMALLTVALVSCNVTETPTPELIISPTVEILPPTSTPIPPTSTPTAGPTDTPVPTVTATPSYPTARVTATILNVRSGPSTTADIITRLQYDTQLRVEGRNAESDWVQVVLDDGSKGWVSAEWVNLSTSISSLPVTEAATATLPPVPDTPTVAVTEEPTPAATPTPLPAPLLLEPAHEQTFDAFGPPRLTWSWEGTLGQGEYFVVTITYPHDDAIWQDVHWVKENYLEPPAYLRGLITGNRRCNWSVVVMRQTGVAEDGLKTGIAISQASKVRSFVWGN